MAGTTTYPAACQARGLVALLTIAYAFSCTDRTILGLLVEPIKADLDLSDTRIELLPGRAFPVFTAATGLPCGWLADRWRRASIIGTGATVRSLATAVSGLARNFAQPFVARTTVGTGEAAPRPASSAACRCC